MKLAGSDIENMIERTVYIRTSAGDGTAFVLERSGQQYLVTAKHVVKNGIDDLLPGETVRIHSDQRMAVRVVERIQVSGGNPDDGDVDVAVLQLNQSLPFQSNAPALGCPEELFVPQAVAMPTAEHWSGFRTGFVITTRTGSIAKIVKPEHRASHTGDFLVEIEAYPGFSGSPIVCWDADGQVRLAGVATRYSWRTMQSFGPAPVHSGFIGCFYIQHAIDLIRVMT